MSDPADDGIKGKRLFSKKESEIDGTHYIVEYYVPESVTDEQFYASVKKKVERLILSDYESEKWRNSPQDSHEPNKP